MKNLLKNEVCGSHEQYMGSTYVSEKWLKSQIVWLKKKNNNNNNKAEKANAQRGRANQTHTYCRFV